MTAQRAEIRLDIGHDSWLLIDGEIDDECDGPAQHRQVAAMLRDALALLESEDNEDNEDKGEVDA